MTDWIDYGKSWKNFRYGGDGLAKSWVQIQLESGECLLIGDINELGGRCDDCVDVLPDDVVARYRIIRNPDK